MADTKTKKIDALSSIHGITDSNRLIASLRDNTAPWSRKVSGELTELEGRWSLDKDHSLRFLIRKEGIRARPKTLKFTGQFTKASADSLRFVIDKNSGEEVSSISYIDLRGTWTTDKFNRLVFSLHGNPGAGRLVFTNSWEMDSSQYIKYRYTVTPSRKQREFTLKGYWQILSARRLVYYLRGTEAGRLQFSVDFQTDNIYPKEGAIKFRIGIGADISRKRTYNLHGTWKLNRDLAVNFRMRYDGRNFRDITFLADKRLSGGKTVRLNLTGGRGRDIGLNLVIDKSLNLKGCPAKVFLETLYDNGDFSVQAGMKGRF